MLFRGFVGHVMHNFINLLSPKSDKHLISPFSIATWSNIQVIRIKEMTTNNKMSWFLIKSTKLVTQEI